MPITPEGQTPTDRFTELGRQGEMRENIMRQTEAMSNFNYGRPECCQKSCMYSKGHQANVLISEYTRFGYDIVTEPLTQQVYAAQEFALPVFQ